ncbi:hypothetical protein ALO95_200241 [Pseudomonas syringae pv. antirrhini]|uniref:hypothetical protein n=1 Tax=Pseudomonas TaxID=286 RepID=UPI00070F9694|nr:MULTISPECIES: hypothetical protein [Pseudomonas]RMW23526.1 hypothetical protein ALO95_200241 [Pseudomonas syringae pv. antirrhini]WIN08796.1 hypothetical protein QQF68_08125 [Pseudomonas syringae pv. antirrhini str. 126]
MDRKLKHLEFVQSVINRLSTNSFLLKGWSVLLISGLFALAAAQDNKGFAIYALAPAIALWGLDGYFLALERNYRKLYDKIRLLNPDQVDFAMMPLVTSGNSDFFQACFSKTILVFHGAVIISIAAAASIF